MPGSEVTGLIALSGPPPLGQRDELSWEADAAPPCMQGVTVAQKRRGNKVFVFCKRAGLRLCIRGRGFVPHPSLESEGPARWSVCSRALMAALAV